MKSWASSLVGGSRRDTLLRAGLAVVLVGALVWFLPARRPGEEGGHHAGQAPPALDPFERGRHRICVEQLGGGNARLSGPKRGGRRISGAVFCPIASKSGRARVYADSGPPA